MAMISDIIQMPTEKQITADCDAFSFVIVADTMKPDIKKDLVWSWVGHFGTNACLFGTKPTVVQTCT